MTLGPDQPVDDFATELMRDERYLNVWHAYHPSYMALVSDVLRLMQPVERRVDLRRD